MELQDFIYLLPPLFHGLAALYSLDFFVACGYGTKSAKHGRPMYMCIYIYTFMFAKYEYPYFFYTHTHTSNTHVH